MSQKINGGPAFPAPTFAVPRDLGDAQILQLQQMQGMTLRDYFAAKAMQSFMHGAVLPPGFDAAEQLAFVGVRAYEVADAMLKAREP